MSRSTLFSLFVFTVLGLAAVGAQAPAPAPAAPKGPDKEVVEKIAVLKDCVLDKKFARDDEGLQVIDFLLQKLKAGVEAKDQEAITRALDGVLTQGVKVRPADNARLYMGAATALGYCGADGAKALKNAHVNKRFPEKKDWVPLREVFLRSLGRTKDESMVKFLTKEALTNPEPALQAAAGEALGNFDEAKEAVRKEIVSDLIAKWGEIEEKASQMGSANIEAQNAKDRLSQLTEKWMATLSKLTGQNFHKYLEWQSWHNKNKNQPWS